MGVILLLLLQSSCLPALFCFTWELILKENLQFKNAKPVEGSLFGTQSSLSPAASLDKQRAELARKHVRALNNQFVRWTFVCLRYSLLSLLFLKHAYLFCLLRCENSWVQIQLKNHPDELWEDGMNDYISHASSILVIFCYVFLFPCPLGYIGLLF